MKLINIAIIGAGSSYSPELIDGFIKEKDNIKINEFRLVDIDNERVNICAGMIRRMLKANGINCNVIVENDLRRAAKDVDFVINQIRVGGLDARIKDEKIPLQFDLLGQETTGAGGFANGLRTVPKVVEIAKTVESVAPDCWFLNFTNPSGMVTQAIMDNTNLKTMGLCNEPINMLDVVSELLDGKEYDYEFIGLNHLCWITAISVGGLDVIDEFYKGGFDSTANLKNIPEAKYDKELLRATGGLPTGYLKYFYFKDKQLQKQKEEELSRGEVCKQIEKELLDIYSDTSVTEKPEQLSKRGGAGYSKMAVSIIKSILYSDESVQIVNTRNNGAYPFMNDDDVVEVKSVITSSSATPVKYNGEQNQYIVGLMKAIKSYERLTIKAALEGDRACALAALMINPLIGEYEKANDVLGEILKNNKPYLENFIESGVL